MKNIAFIGIAAYLLYRFVTGKLNLSNNVNFNLVDVKVVPSFPYTKILITLQVNNPTNESATINSFNGILKLNGNEIGNANSNNRIFIKENSTLNVNVEIFANAISTGTQIIQAIKNKTATFNFIGFANVYGVNLPINFDYKVI
jgi:LEA14-like dessication related protein